MKKMLVAAAVVALVLPALAWSATAPGKYQGTITSVLPDLNGKKCTAEVKNEGTNTVATVVYDNGDKEVWTWNDKMLDQKEYDKTGKMTQQYGATATTPGTYNINCKDKVKNDCDAGVDARNYWTIRANPDAFTYQVFGVPKEKKGDPTAKVERRHEFAFKLAK